VTLKVRLGLVALVAAAGCIDLSVDPDEIVSIEFVEPPWPSVVAGDTLRDSSGRAAPLTARLFNADGDVVSGSPVTFIPRDTMVTIDGDVLLGRASADGTAQVVASGGGLQSVVRRVEVVRAPDSLSAEGTVAPLLWVIPDVASTNTSVALRVKVWSRSGTSGVGVRAWIVTFRAEFQGAPIAAGDTTRFFLVGDNGRSSSVDTTDASGNASRQIRLRSEASGIPGQPDSVIVFASARYLGAELAGSPVRLVLPIRPR
jgi:hypothetical protein